MGLVRRKKPSQKTAFFLGTVNSKKIIYSKRESIGIEYLEYGSFQIVCRGENVLLCAVVGTCVSKATGSEKMKISKRMKNSYPAMMDSSFRCLVENGLEHSSVRDFCKAAYYNI